MGNKLSISIITPTFNRADELDCLLRSISEQTYPLTDIECIISDDGSNDNTEMIVRKWQKKAIFVYFKKFILQNSQTSFWLFKKAFF